MVRTTTAVSGWVAAIVVVAGRPPPPGIRRSIWNLSASYGQGAIIAATRVFGIALGINLAVYVAWRARAIPVYPLVLDVVGWLVFTTFSGDPWLPSLGTGMVAIGLAWAGVVVLKMRDEVWDRL